MNTCHFDRVRALELLRIGSGDPAASFRQHQEDAIRHIVEGGGRLLVVQKTGWGKSFVYFIATKLLREAGAGPALLVSPLLALMRNQIEAAKRMGVRAATINSSNESDWQSVERQIARDEVDIVLISPERLSNERFSSKVLSRIAARVSLLVIDEAHCISDWGHDFRPHYRLIERTVRAMPANMRILATTATANDRVMSDLTEILGPDLTVVRGDLARPSLTLQTIRLPSQAERLAWLAERLTKLEGSGIVYTLTVRDANLVSSWLRSRGIHVLAYHGDMEADAREEREHALLSNEVKALVATTALGMGYDKPDLAFVIHYQKPGSVVHYYQQVGRAGRAIDSAYGVLLSGAEEEDINDWFIHSAFPTRAEVTAILDALREAEDGLSVPSLAACVNIKRPRIEKTLALLALESPAPLVKDDVRWRLTAASLSKAFWERAERLTNLRREEQNQMRAYAELPFGRHMKFLIDALDGDSTNVSPPSRPPLPEQASVNMIREATAFLRRTSLPFEPRAQWPQGGMPLLEVTGKIAESHRAMPGRALCAWGDAGWGETVRHGKYRDRRFADELVEACASMLRDWNPQPAPTWVTCVPSLRHPSLVPDFAQRLAEALGLPFHLVISKIADRPEQKTMQNATFQARNVDGSLAVSDADLPTGPVLLVDDIVDSRWTVTVAAWLLRKAGSGPVWPLALALAGPET